MEGVFQAKENIIQYGNKYLATLLNISLDDIIGRSIIDLFGEENRVVLENTIEVLNTSKEEVDRSVFLKPFNNLQELQLRLYLIQGKDAEKLIAGSIQKSTRPEVVPYPLLNNRYNALFEHFINCIIIYDYEKDRIVSVNTAMVNALEYDTKEELIGLSRLDIIPKTSNYAPGLDLHKLVDDHENRFLKGESFSSKAVFIGKNGKEIFCNSKIVPIGAKRGEGMILLQDITKRLTDINNENLVQTKYRNIFDNSHEAIIYIDPENKLPTICNANAMQMFDLTTLEDVRNLRLSDFIKELEIEGIPVHEYYNKVVKKVIQNGREEISFWVHNKSGGIIRAYAVLIKDNSDQEHPRIICFIRDITELYNTQQVLEEKNKELEKYITSNNQLENFAYFASHDLKAPLNTILSFSKLLQKKLVDDERKDVAEFLKFIVTSGEGMKTLIDDLLEYSLVNSTDIEIKQVNLDRQLYVLLHSLDAMIKEKAAIIELNNIPKTILVDPIKLKQVFQNLITNGIKFVKPGVQPKLIISCEEVVDHWCFSISDNGIGISPEHQEKIFGLFKRLHSSAEYKGTGIGLAIVKKIIEQHNGIITLKSELGKGTIFRFTIAKDLAEVGQSQKLKTKNMEMGTVIAI